MKKAKNQRGKVMEKVAYMKWFTIAKRKKNFSSFFGKKGEKFLADACKFVDLMINIFLE